MFFLSNSRNSTLLLGRHMTRGKDSEQGGALNFPKFPSKPPRGPDGSGWMVARPG